MGLIEEVIILIKEAIDEANQRGRPRPQQSQPRRAPPPDDADGDDLDGEHPYTEEELEALRRSHLEARQAAQEAEEREREAARQRAERERQQALERERAQRRQAEVAAQVRMPVVTNHVARLLRQPQTLRQVVVLREILDKPVALRRK